MLHDRDDAFDTTFDVDSIPVEEGSLYFARSPLEMEERRARVSRDQEDDFEVDEKDETEEIVRGFILEKGIINEEHEKEKRELIDSLMKDREELIEKFKKQVMEVEKRLNKTEEDGHKQRDFGASKSHGDMPLYIRLGKRNIIGADDFLARLKYEDKFESEKDTLERNLRDEKRLLKGRMELECERKLQVETRRFESAMEGLRSTIKELRLENKRLGKEVKDKELEMNSKITEMKSRLSNEKAKFDTEKYMIRNELERKHEVEIDSLRSGYEMMLSELKTDFKEASRSISKKEEQVSIALSNVKDYETRVRSEIASKVSEEYGDLFDQLRHRNERLVDQVDKLTRENGRLAGKLKELDDSSENRMSIVNEFTNRLNREYEDRLKTAVLESERLKAEIEELRNENRIQEGALKDFRESTARLEDELTVKNELLAGSEEIKASLRKEIVEFSSEVDVLRREKGDLLKSVDECSEAEKGLVEKMSKKDKQASDALDKFRISERERMCLERKMAMLSEEHEQCLQDIEKLKNEIRKSDEEAFALKKLLDEERREHDRFRERFRRDAEEIRGKESECRALREQLRNKTNNIDFELNKSAEKVDRLMTLEADNFELQKKLRECEGSRDELLRREREEIQRQFAKEFAKRIHSMKRSYEEAADALKSQIKMLRSKVTDLEGLLAARDIEEGTGHKYEESVLELDGKESEKSELGHLSKLSRRKTHSDNSECSVINGSSVRLLDYAPNCKRSTTTSKTCRSLPAEEFDLSANKMRNMEPGARIYQGAFSRQRSRSVDSSVGRYAVSDELKSASRTQGKLHRFDGLNSEPLQITDYASNEASEGKRTEKSGPRVGLKLSKTLNERGYSQDERYRETERSNADNDIRGMSNCIRNGGGYVGHYREVTGLPPKYRTNNSLKSNEGSKCWNGQANRAAEKIERSVEKLQERLEEGHNELLRRLELMQTSVR